MYNVTLKNLTKDQFDLLAEFCNFNGLKGSYNLPITRKGIGGTNPFPPVKEDPANQK